MLMLALGRAQVFLGVQLGTMWDHVLFSRQVDSTGPLKFSSVPLHLHPVKLTVVLAATRYELVALWSSPHCSNLQKLLATDAHKL